MDPPVEHEIRYALGNAGKLKDMADDDDNILADPPEEHEIRYALGDAGKLKDMADDDDNILAVARLKPRDYCFVLRSGGIFTFAKVISRQHGSEGLLEVQVDSYGSTKTIPISQCAAKYVRTLKRTAQQKSPYEMYRRSFSEPPAQKSKSSGPGIERLSSVQANFNSTSNPDDCNNRRRRPSGNKQSTVQFTYQAGLNGGKFLRPGIKRHSTLPAEVSAPNPCAERVERKQRKPSQKNKSHLHSSCQPGLQYGGLQRPGIKRHSSVRAGSQSTLNTDDCGRRSPSLKKHASLHSSFESGLNDVKLQPARQFEADHSARSGLNGPSRRLLRRSCVRTNLRSSIETHIPEEYTSISDALDRSSSDQSDSERRNSSEDLKTDFEAGPESSEIEGSKWSSSSTSDEESPLPQSHTTMEEKKGSMKRVSMPRGFDDIEINEKALLAAFHSI